MKKIYFVFGVLLAALLVAVPVSAQVDDFFFFPEMWEVGELKGEYDYEYRFYRQEITVYGFMEPADHTGWVDVWYTFEYGEDRRWRLIDVRQERHGNRVYRPQHSGMKRYMRAVLNCRWNSEAAHVWDGVEGNAVGFAGELYDAVGPICEEWFGQSYPPPN